jgi:hypothetical protein
MNDYVTAERRGRESLRRFLLDLDAKETNELEPRTIAEVLELYLAVNAHPRNEGGLAPSTYARYESVVGRHMLAKPRARGHGAFAPPTAWALAFSAVPAARFNGPQASRAWREQMQREGVPMPTRHAAWRVLSAALSWAVASQLVIEIETNGCKLAAEPRGTKRRSLRAGGTGYAPRGRRRGSLVPSWALSPQAVEAIRTEMLKRTSGRDQILAQRDAMIVSLQYGLCMRNQELWGMRWSSLEGEFAWVLEVLSNGRLDEWGKTAHSTQRRTAIPTILQEDLAEWREALNAAGHPPPERSTSSSPATSQATSTAPATRAAAPATSAKTKPAPGANASSPLPSSRPPSSPSSSRSSALPPTRCAAAASPCACAPRIHRPSPASAAPACGCSQTTTPTRSRTFAATDHARLTRSGAQHEPNKQSMTHTSSHPPSA